MKTSDLVQCTGFPCTDMDHKCCAIPGIDVQPERVRIVMISEAAPARASDYYYAGGDSLFEKTTQQAFRDAGANVSSFQDILGLGVYLTTAVKCGKTAYGIETKTVKQCSLILEKELSLFPNAQVLMLMGDVAIKALNEIARCHGAPRVIPAGSTYKIRSAEHRFKGVRVFPSYLQAGPSFFIEKSKRRMIAEDISRALKVVGFGHSALV
jgi:uracil-DNA glycosylase